MSEPQVGEEYHEADFQAWRGCCTREHTAAIELMNVSSWKGERLVGSTPP